MKPDSEWERLEALRRYEILDTPREEEFDEMARLAATIGQMPMALVSLVDRERQWFKAEVGVGRRETPIEQSFCRHALLEKEVLVVPDARLDFRFRDNPLVTGEMGLRAYAGAVLRNGDGVPFGTLCVLDREPRQFAQEVIEALKVLARQVERLLELRLAMRRLRNTIDSLRGPFVVIGRDRLLIEANDLAREILSGGARMEGRDFRESCRLDEASPLTGVIENVLEGGRMSSLEFFHDASGRWLGCEIYPAPDGVLVHLRDVTKRRSQEHRLRDVADELGQKVREMDFLHLAWDLLQKEEGDLKSLLDDLLRGAVTALKRREEVVVEVAHRGVIRRSAEMGVKWGCQVREDYRTERGAEGWVAVTPESSVREGDVSWLAESERRWLRRLAEMLKGDAERWERREEMDERLKAFRKRVECEAQAMWLCEREGGRVVDANAEARRWVERPGSEGEELPLRVEWQGAVKRGWWRRGKGRLEGILREEGVEGREIRVREVLADEGDEESRYVWVSPRFRVGKRGWRKRFFVAGDR